MQNTLSKMEMLDKALKVLPATEEDIVLTGIISKIAERIAVLKKVERTLIEKYESVKKTENKLGTQINAD
ncbi:MAG: hypothetical protein J7K81_07255 [Methanophagales archaeon]|nr:hypothetical protein [Methanophagales archaeon]